MTEKTGEGTNEYFQQVISADSPVKRPVESV
jgi:hypothetical protein